MRELFVGITAWNSEMFLPACLASLRRCTEGMDVRVVVVDNASTDATPEIAARYGAELVSIRCSQAAAINHLIAMSDARRTLLIHSDVVFLSNQWFSLCSDRIRDDVVLVSPEDIGCGPLTREFGISHPESSFLLFDTKAVRALRTWTWSRRWGIRFPKRLLDLSAPHLTHGLRNTMDTYQRKMHLMSVHASPSAAEEWYIPPFAPEYWDPRLGRLIYGLGNFYSIDGVVTHYHNWYERRLKDVPVDSFETTEPNGGGFPLGFVSESSRRFLEDWREGRLKLPVVSNIRVEPVGVRRNEHFNHARHNP